MIVFLNVDTMLILQVAVKLLCRRYRDSLLVRASVVERVADVDSSADGSVW